MNIGYQALIDLSNPYFKPDIVPKYENGASLLPGDAWPVFATETTVYGLAEGEDHNRDFWFVWREDTGLILKKNNQRNTIQLYLKQANSLSIRNMVCSVLISS